MNWQERPYLGDKSLPSEADTQALGAALAALLRPGESMLLSGDLGLGKTTLARRLIQTLIPEVKVVESPTFNMVHLYDQGAFPVWHADLYRLDHPDEWHELGLDETQEGVTLIEWPEKAERFLPKEALCLQLVDTEEGRKALFYGEAAWMDRLAPIMTEGS